MKILIDAADPEESRMALIRNNQLVDFRIETASSELTRGNIYKGIITHIEPSLQAAFVDYGAERSGFLQQHEIHSENFKKSPSRDKGKSHSLQNLIARGQEILVQVTKEPILNKGANLTTYISLPGRYMVLMPGGRHLGVSRKIEEDTERSRLKDLIDSLEVPEGLGVIIRTAGRDQNKRELSRDVRYLTRLWQDIKKRGQSRKGPCLLYKERHFAIRAIRDFLSLEVTEILVNDREVFRDVRNFMRIISPRQLRCVKHYQSAQPLFSKYELESQITSIFAPRVDLSSGGSIVINQTEALVAIDVNSGKATRKDSMEETAYTTNLEAVSEIARQLRLRDLGGLIVIDFIDMRESKHKQSIFRLMKDQVKIDKARVNIARLSLFGLMEMSRQRIGPSIEYGNYTTCRQCGGKGVVPSTEKLALDFMRRLRTETLKSDIKTVRVLVPPNVADYLLNRKRKDLLEVELKRNLTISIEPSPALQPGECEITCV
ncbi:Rne/Rng family ribonuclease [bacterium]|nr:Rne/Rng family ribonuclease [bacterium]